MYDWGVQAQLHASLDVWLPRQLKQMRNSTMLAGMTDAMWRPKPIPDIIANSPSSQRLAHMQTAQCIYMVQHQGRPCCFLVEP